MRKVINIFIFYKNILIMICEVINVEKIMNEGKIPCEFCEDLLFEQCLYDLFTKQDRLYVGKYCFSCWRYLFDNLISV